MKNFVQRVKEQNRIPKSGEIKTAKDSFLRGAFWGLLLLSLFIMAFAGFYFRTGLPIALQVSAYVLLGILAFYLFRWVASVLKAITDHFPIRYLSIILAVIGIVLLAQELRLSWPNDVLNYTLAAFIIGAIFIGGAIYSLIKKQGSIAFCTFSVVLGLVCFYLPLRQVIPSGEDSYPVDFQPVIKNSLTDLGISNHSENGDYSFKYFTYGSGNNDRRPEFGDSVDYQTETVDASLLLPDWSGKKKKWRERFWGFGIEEAPINGRFWMPEKEGKSPIVLIVHGNHSMEHFSDPGYAYLGELLASRGFITVSVDENYINGTWSGDFRGKEMPIRAWLLLKHLEQWKNWTEDTSSDFFERADLENVILIGHSRGGEAVSIAAQFNELAYFPDNANVKFDFNFGIKGLVTIAPTDQRYFRRMELKNINYLSLQGSYDADEVSFFGLRQYQRINYTDSLEYFKAGVLIHRANHGQFNSIWGRRDFGEPYGWFLNTGALISGEEQRKAAKVYISAFAERVFNQREDLEPLFVNSATAADWLPNTVFLNNYSTSKDSILVNYEEDIDLTSTSIGKAAGNNLMVWREQPLMMRGGETQGTNAVILGWDNDSISATAAYQLSLNDSLDMANYSELLLTLGRASDKDLEVADTTDIDFQIQLITDSDTFATSLLQHKRLAPKLKVRYMKLEGMNNSFGGNWEIATESVSIPLSDFGADSTTVKSIRFIFNQTEKGLIALDNIGFRH
ncbi:MAG: hypothetical protein JJ909_11335 [Roseivirga sp.]|uniref:hypothetical protein n=1 Tax=Roseivirga sp. TaxID=1964215 RepID=UPI001B1A9FB4|nr:hypothetical protein [Roseivirga sp.]MBO6662865.1 hypothetical protein [Roseivirga sp.]MBO6761545.1 hypothetical protein [Roseivirga sp.]MBO6909757.1 hypothetical protein [Roseivirga sp.]